MRLILCDEDLQEDRKRVEVYELRYEDFLPKVQEAISVVGIARFEYVHRGYGTNIHPSKPAETVSHESDTASNAS